MAFEAGNHVTVRGYEGIAFYLVGKEQVFVQPNFDWDDVDDFNDYEEVVDGERWIAIMVGDDREFIFEEDELTLIDEDEYCGSCGQIGCSHG